MESINNPDFFSYLYYIFAIENLAFLWQGQGVLSLYTSNKKNQIIEYGCEGSKTGIKTAQI